jgi:hypothetical protein
VQADTVDVVTEVMVVVKVEMLNEVSKYSVVTVMVGTSI